MSERKIINDSELDQVAGGQLAFDKTNRIVYIGTEGNVRKFKVNEGVDLSDIDTLLASGYSKTNTNDENDTNMINAILGSNKVTEF